MPSGNGTVTSVSSIGDSRPFGGPGDRAWATYLKAIAIVLVVAYHIALLSAPLGAEDRPTVVALRDVMVGIPIPAFLVVAGMRSARIPTWSFRDLVRRRLVPLVYLFVLWTVLRFAVLTVVAPPSLDRLLLLVRSLIVSDNYLWFLQALALYTLLFWALRRWLPPAIVAVVVVLVSGGVGLGLLTTGVGALNRIIGFSSIFVLAALVGPRVAGTIARFTWWHLVTASAGGAVTASLLFALPDGSGHVRNALMMLGGVLWLVAAMAVSATMARHPGRFARVHALGEDSLRIYVVHYFVVIVFLAAIAWAAPSVAVPAVVAAVVFTPVVMWVTVQLLKVLPRASWLFVPPRWLRRAANARLAHSRPRG